MVQSSGTGVFGGVQTGRAAYFMPIRDSGRSAISGPMRYTAALVPIDDFEGNP
jgi:hypothetical protein